MDSYTLNAIGPRFPQSRSPVKGDRTYARFCLIGTTPARTRRAGRATRGLAAPQCRSAGTTVRDEHAGDLSLANGLSCGKLGTMCYSAMGEQRLRAIAKEFRADIDWKMFEQLFSRRLEQDIKVGRALEANFLGPSSPQNPSDVERLTRTRIEAIRAKMTESLEGDVFKQKKRPADAQRSLKSKETKGAREQSASRKLRSRRP